MDEPLSNLDAKLRVQMRAEITSLQKQLGVTTIYVTHDQIEAMTMGDRVAVLKGGVLQQVDTPKRLYESPVNAFVAGFIGSPSMNLFEATMTGDLEGFSRWTIKPGPEGSVMRFDEEVTTNKRSLNLLAPIARPAFKANHTFMMRHGEAGLRTFLAGLRLGRQLPPSA